MQRTHVEKLRKPLQVDAVGRSQLDCPPLWTWYDEQICDGEMEKTENQSVGCWCTASWSLYNHRLSHWTHHTATEPSWLWAIREAQDERKGLLSGLDILKWALWSSSVMPDILVSVAHAAVPGWEWSPRSIWAYAVWPATCCPSTILRLCWHKKPSGCEWNVWLSEATLKPVIHATAGGHEWISGPDTAGAVLMSVAHDRTTGQEDCGLGYNWSHVDIHGHWRAGLDSCLHSIDAGELTLTLQLTAQWLQQWLGHRRAGPILHWPMHSSAVVAWAREKTYLSLGGWPLAVWLCTSEYMDNTKWTFFSFPFGGT